MSEQNDGDYGQEFWTDMLASVNDVYTFALDGKKRGFYDLIYAQTQEATLDSIFKLYTLLEENVDNALVKKKIVKRKREQVVEEEEVDVEEYNGVVCPGVWWRKKSIKNRTCGKKYANFKSKRGRTTCNDPNGHKLCGSCAQILYRDTKKQEPGITKLLLKLNN